MGDVIPIALARGNGRVAVVKLFYTGPWINVEMLLVMLEKHGIAATHEFLESSQADDDELNRPANVFVPDPDYERAYQLFYTPREDEL